MSHWLTHTKWCQISTLIVIINSTLSYLSTWSHAMFPKLSTESDYKNFTDNTYKTVAIVMNIQWSHEEVMWVMDSSLRKT